VEKIGVYDKVPIELVYQRTGRHPIKVQWIDAAEGDGTYFSRLVAKEFKTSLRPELFSATPPGQCCGADGACVGVLYSDISRAYFHAPAREEKYVDLPMEDASEGKCGRLRVSMCGTRDTAANWEEAYAVVLIKAVFVRGRASLWAFNFPKRG
jgi:hypothetical protein